MVQLCNLTTTLQPIEYGYHPIKITADGPVTIEIGDTYINPIRPIYNDPCEFCPNNPAVNPHASGMCNCALPALRNPIYC